jgi:hypothetical protein
VYAAVFPAVSTELTLSNLMYSPVPSVIWSRFVSYGWASHEKRMELFPVSGKAGERWTSKTSAVV